MSRVAILVIAALQRPVYRHYIRSYWTEMIRYTNRLTPGIDVFMLIEHGMDREPFAHIADNVIEDTRSDFEAVLASEHRSPGVPTILNKTVHAFDVLAGDYDLFFRTNLSSMIRLPAFTALVDSRPDLGYSGAWIWDDALRADILHHQRVGPDKPLTAISELDGYPGNTFISGSGFFMNAAEASGLVERRSMLRYDLPDDVAIGLMMKEHEYLPGFSMVVRPSETVPEMLERIRSSPAGHVRVQHFPVELAEQLWHAQLVDPVWF